MEKLVKDGEPLKEWKCSCGYVQKLKVKSLLEIEQEIDFYAWNYKQGEKDNDVNRMDIYKEKIDSLKWAIGWFDNTH